MGRAEQWQLYVRPPIRGPAALHTRPAAAVRHRVCGRHADAASPRSALAPLGVRAVLCRLDHSGVRLGAVQAAVPGAADRIRRRGCGAGRGPAARAPVESAGGRAPAWRRLRRGLLSPGAGGRAQICYGPTLTGLRGPYPGLHRSVGIRQGGANGSGRPPAPPPSPTAQYLRLRFPHGQRQA